jgi:VIT1/CCC1 family predicted Fe2+/Mn2+ transporter
LKLAGGNLAAATLGMIPLGLLMAAIGYLFSGWLHCCRPRFAGARGGPV